MSSGNSDPSLVSVSSGDVAPAPAPAPSGDADADAHTSVESAVSLLKRVLVTVPPVIHSCSSDELDLIWSLVASIHETLSALVDKRGEELEKRETRRPYYAELQSQFDQRLRRPYPDQQTVRDLVEKTRMTDTENDPPQLITSGLLDPTIHQELSIYKVPRPIIIRPAVDLQTALQDQLKQQQTHTQTQTNATPTTASNSNLSSSSSDSVPFPYPCVVSPSDRSRIMSYMLYRGFVVASSPSSYPVSAMWLTAPSIGCGFILQDEHGKDVNHDVTSSLWRGIQGNSSEEWFQVPK